MKNNFRIWVIVLLVLLTIVGIGLCVWSSYAWDFWSYIIAGGIVIFTGLAGLLIVLRG